MEQYEKIQQMSESLDMQLLSQVGVESMLGDLDYSPKSEYSDLTMEIRLIQEMYSHYCIQSKVNITYDRLERSAQTMVTAFIKNRICKYLADSRNRNNHVMKYLYEDNDPNIVAQQISTLALHSFYKNGTNENSSKASLNQTQVCTSIGIYTYFTLLANPYFDAEDYNELFVEAWFKYYGGWMASQLMIKMSGPNWTDEFKGVLLDY